MNFRTADAQFYARVEGEDQPPIILLHGLGENHSAWDPVFTRLCEGRLTAALDLRGAGRSELGTADYSFSRLAADVVALMDTLPTDTAHIVGHSFGGVLCQELMVTHPTRVASAVLISTSATLGQAATERWERLAASVERKGLHPTPASKSRVFSENYAAEHPDAVERYEAEIANCPAQTYAAQARAASRYEYTEALRELPIPTLVLQGLADRLTAPGGSVLLSRALKGSQLELLEDVGHNVHIELGDRFAEKVLAFIEDVDGRPQGPA